MSERIEIMNLAQLRAALAEKIKGLPAIRDKAMAENATQEDTDALKAAMDEVKALEAKIATAVEVDEAIKRSALPVDENVTERGNATVPAETLKKLTPVQRIGVSMTAMLAAHHNKTSPLDELEKHGFGTIAKELITTTPSAGGYAVPKNLDNEIIEILREESAFLRGNPRRIGLQNGNMNLAAGDTGVTGGYGAEATDISVEQQTFREVNLSAKRLSVLVPVSNELLSWSIGDMEAFVKDDMNGALGELMDTNLLRGSGLSNTPLGIFRIPGIPTFAALPATGTQAQIIAAVEATLARAEWEMRSRKVMGRRAAWIMSPRTRIWLSGLRDANGNRVYPELSYGPGTNNAAPMLRSKPVYETGHIPINLGTSGLESEIALVDYQHVLFGETESGFQFAVSSEASYKVSGTVYSAFQRNVTLFRALTHHDTDVRHVGAVVVITAVDWGDELAVGA
jgi:HK97 family phage major capsid protein